MARMTSAGVIKSMQRGKRADDVHAAVLGQILLVAVAERHDARFPAAAPFAAAERAGAMNELMMRIGFPVRRLAAAGDDDARAVLRPARPAFQPRPPGA